MPEARLLDTPQCPNPRMSGYYSYPEALMVLRCTNCSFVWDFPYVATIEDDPLSYLGYEPLAAGDERCPKCMSPGEDTSLAYPFDLSHDYQRSLG